MDEAQAVNKIEADLTQEKIDFINDAHAKKSGLLEKGCIRKQK